MLSITVSGKLQQNAATAQTVRFGMTVRCLQESQNIGAIEIGVLVPSTHPKWSDVAIQDEEWTSLTHIITDNTSELDYDMLQQVIEARPGKKYGERLHWQPGSHFGTSHFGSRSETLEAVRLPCCLRVCVCACSVCVCDHNPGGVFLLSTKKLSRLAFQPVVVAQDRRKVVFRSALRNGAAHPKWL